MRYVLFEHAGSGNHGCEAIVRSTAEMLAGNSLVLQTYNYDEDIEFGLDKITRLVTSRTESVDENSLKGYALRLQARMKSGLDFDICESMYKNKALLYKDSVALSIGGDNYCYLSIIESMREKLNVFSAKNIPVVLWGCSIDDTYIDYSKNDLKRYALITTRESLTTQLLRENSITENVVECSDPAFTLKKQSYDGYEYVFDSAEVIGINVSDFMRYYNAYDNATYKNFRTLIKYIIEFTDYRILLIPHVRHKENDDLLPMKKLAKDFDTDRIVCVDKSLNCMQIKDVISKCKLFVGCRTHSTIAAYSTCVPTLVVGYSIKARGIAKDLFGDEKEFLVDVRAFRNDGDLLAKFLEFSEKEDEMRDRLKRIMPGYIERAYSARDALYSLKL